MLPIILYLDKSGTDVRQRFSREPPLFTTAALNRESRENRPFWRQLGFIPSSKNIEDSKGSLQFYHQCLGAILSGSKEAQHTLPCLRIKNSSGTTRIMRAHLPLMIIMGDQLSERRGQHLCIPGIQHIKSNGRITGYQNSILTTNYKMQCSCKNVPVAYSINCASIDSALRHDSTINQRSK